MTQAQAMLLSMAVEAAVAYGVVAWRRWPGRGPASAAFGIAVATALTHPLLWPAALWLYERAGFAAGAIIAETAVVLAEAAIIARIAHLSPRHALVVSVLGNAASVAAGLWIGS